MSSLPRTQTPAPFLRIVLDGVSLSVLRWACSWTDGGRVGGRGGSLACADVLNALGSGGGGVGGSRVFVATLVQHCL